MAPAWLHLRIDQIRCTEQPPSHTSKAVIQNNIQNVEVACLHRKRTCTCRL